MKQAILSAATISAVPTERIYRLVTVARERPTSAAMVASGKPRSLAMLAKLWRRT